MGRLILVVIMLIISGVIFLVKAGVGKITGNEVKFQDESKKVMQSTAKGINWMNEQWEKAKQNAGGSSDIKIGSGANSELSALEIIAKVKSDTVKYDMASSEAFYIEQAVIKINKRQFDDATKLIMQIQAGEARDFMLNEIESKRKS